MRDCKLFSADGSNSRAGKYANSSFSGFATSRNDQISDVGFPSGWR